MSTYTWSTYYSDPEALQSARTSPINDFYETKLRDLYDENIKLRELVEELQGQVESLEFDLKNQGE